MRKIVLMPDSLEYRELSPFTLDEFSELFEAYGDVEDAYQSFLEQNDFYELCDIDEQFETYEVVVTSGDPIYTFDNVAMPKVSSGVVSLVKQLPKEKPLKIEKCAVLSLSNEGEYYMYMPTSQSWQCIDLHEIEENFGLYFVLPLFDLNEDASTIAEAILSQFPIDVRPRENRLHILDVNTSVNCSWSNDEANDMLQSGLNPVYVYNGQVTVYDITVNMLGLAFGVRDNLYDAYIMLNAVNFALRHFNRITPANFSKFMEFNSSPEHKIELFDGEIHITSRTLNPKSLVIRFNLNELTQNYGLYCRKFIN